MVIITLSLKMLLGLRIFSGNFYLCSYPDGGVTLSLKMLFPVISINCVPVQSVARVMVSFKMLFPVATSNCLITGVCHNYCPAVVKMFKKIIEKIASPIVFYKSFKFKYER